MWVVGFWLNNSTLFLLFLYIITLIFFTVKRHFSVALTEFFVNLLPQMLGLLHKNMIANPEKHLLGLIDELLVKLDQLAKEGKSVNDNLCPNSNLNKVSWVSIINDLLWQAKLAHLITNPIEQCPVFDYHSLRLRSVLGALLSAHLRWWLTRFSIFFFCD